MEQQYMLTTLDNPFNPFVDFSSWYMFDCEKEHNTSSRLARIANLNSEMTQKEIDEEMDRAMNLIVKFDFEDLYVKATKEQIEKWLKNKKNNRKSMENAEDNEDMQTATAINA